MRLEALPILFGVLLGLVGLALVLDAWSPDDLIISRERRRKPRRGRDRFGEALVGLGVLAMAAAFVGRDTWRYSIVTVIAGSVLLLWGVLRNAKYMGGVLSRHEQPQPAPAKQESQTP